MRAPKESQRTVVTLRMWPEERKLFVRMGKAEGKGWSTVMREYAIRYAAEILGVDPDDLLNKVER